MRKFIRLIIASLLALPLINHAQLPTIAWKKCLGGSGDDRSRSIIPGYDHGYLVAGSTKSNNGDLTAHYGSTDSSDAWLVKLDAQGNIAWQRNYGGTGNDEFSQVITTSDQQYIAIGTTNSVNNGDVAGFHPSSGGTQETDIWVMKIDRQGNPLWQRCLGGSGSEIPGAIRQTPDGGFVIAASAVSGIYDGDIPAADSGRMWIIKLDATGGIEWSERYGGGGASRANDIRVLPGVGYLVAGQNSSYDGDFPVVGYEPNAISLKIGNDGGILSVSNQYQRSDMTNVIKQAGDTNYLFVRNWQNCVPANNDILGIALHTRGGLTTFEACDMTQTLSYTIRGRDIIAFRPDNSLLLAAGTTDSRNLTIKGGEDAFLTNYDDKQPTGTRVRYKTTFGGSGTDAFTGITTLDNNAIVCVGYTNSTDGDVTGNHGSFDAWIVQFAPANYITGTIFYDWNSNGTKDANEVVADNIMVKMQKDTTSITTSAVQGSFGFIADTGVYTVSLPQPPDNFTVNPASQTSSFSGSGATINLTGFALQPIPGKRDYEVKVGGYSAIRPGFDVQYWFSYANNGTDTLANKPVKLIKDSRLQFISSTPTHTSIAGDTIIWNITQLLPGSTVNVFVNLKAATPPTLDNDDTVSLVTFIDSTGDILPNNNVVVLRERVTGSFDPNDKQEAHGSMLFKHEYDAGNWLTYTIRFQNTGNDTAFNIMIADTLLSGLQGATLQMTGASHPYNLQIKDNKYCSWTFSNILLPDSNRNEPGSHGYLTFRIKPANGLVIGNKILNTAAIYFDFNPPVITNTHETIVRATPVAPPATPVTSGLQTAYCSAQGVQTGKISNLPLAGSGTTASAMIDNKPLTIAADSTVRFNPDTLSAGAHNLVITYVNAGGVRSTTQTFQVSMAVTPVVKITASPNPVISLTAPVIFTANNNAGGGTAPLYTFAKDKSFTQIVQAESASATYTLQPNTLLVGDNKFYVRMKSNATCYTALTAIDSIVIKRDAATGIIDPDNPGQSIVVFPNPFDKQLNVSGLNSGKTYLVLLTSSGGQVHYRAQVRNKRVLTIPVTGLNPGLYWITLYDTKKNLLGSEKVIKY